MAAFSIVYISAAWAFYGIGFGDTSLVYANIINLSARIVFSATFISSYFKSDGVGTWMRWRHMLPRWQVWSALVMSAISIWYRDQVLGATEMVQTGGWIAILTYPVMIHVGLGGILALTCVVTW